MHKTDWIGLSRVLRPRQHSIGYMGDGFYRSERPNQQYQSTEGTYSTEITQKYTIINLSLIHI